MLLLKVMKKGIGEESPASLGNRPCAAPRPAVPKQDQFLRVLHRQRAEEDGVEEREYRSIGANAQGEREDGDGGEAGASEELANGEAEVLEQVLGDGFPARRPHLVLHRCGAADLDASCAKRGFPGHAGALFVGSRGLGKRGQLLVEFAIDTALLEEGLKPAVKIAEEVHASPPGDNRFRLRGCGGWRPPGGPIAPSRRSGLCVRGRSACSTWRGGCSRWRATPT